MFSTKKMNDDTYNEFRRIIYQQSGIYLNENKKSLLISRIYKRLRATGITSFEKYLEYLKSDTSGDEIVHFLDVISTNVTRFFREEAHFQFLAKTVREWINMKKQKIRIWSAACSTGEEPYSIAMCLAENCNYSTVDWKILATDISTSALKQAQAGVYPASALKNIPLNLIKRYFRPVNNDEQNYTIINELKRRIYFTRLNLVRPPFPMQGPLDIIFCRNVMIYFDDAARNILLNEIERLLSPEGYLIVGASESLVGSTATNFVSVQTSIFKKK